MKVRELRESDFPRVMEIERRSFPDPWKETVFRGWAGAPEHLTLVAVAREGGAPSPQRDESETVLGYLTAMSVLDEGEIANVAVAPEHRRKGVADALVAALEARAREKGLRLLHLEVRAGNGSALALYEKHGFRAVGLRKSYYEKPREDAILMTLELET